MRSFLLALLLPISAAAEEATDWSAQELRIIESLRLKPTQQTIDQGLLRLGQRYFFDARLSKNQQVSCASCHQPQLDFTDGQKLAFGQEQGSRNTPSLRGAGQRTWLTWDGRKDSVWAQSIAPFENTKEHGIPRIQALKLATENPLYFENFGSPPDFTDQTRFPPEASPLGNAAALRTWKAMAKDDRMLVNKNFANLGVALSHYIESLVFKPNRFDQYATALMNKEPTTGILNQSEIDGLKLFIGPQSGCLNCHSGSQFTNQAFFNIGTGSPKDLGRFSGVKHLIRDEFNCEGGFSHSKNCDPLKFTQRRGHELKGAFLTPTLRGTAATAPYMHDGSFPTLESVIAYYSSNPKQFNSNIHLPETELSSEEQRQLVDFIKTLN